MKQTNGLVVWKAVVAKIDRDHWDALLRVAERRGIEAPPGYINTEEGKISELATILMGRAALDQMTLEVEEKKRSGCTVIER